MRDFGAEEDSLGLRNLLYLTALGSSLLSWSFLIVLGCLAQVVSATGSPNKS